MSRYFLTHGDLIGLALIGLFFVVRNWWDLIRYGFMRSAGAPEAPRLPRAAIAVKTRLRHVIRAVPTPRLRPVQVPHRPLHHALP